MAGMHFFEKVCSMPSRDDFAVQKKRPHPFFRGDAAALTNFKEGSFGVWQIGNHTRLEAQNGHSVVVIHCAVKVYIRVASAIFCQRNLPCHGFGEEDGIG